MHGEVSCQIAKARRISLVSSLNSDVFWDSLYLKEPEYVISCDIPLKVRIPYLRSVRTMILFNPLGPRDRTQFLILPFCTNRDLLGILISQVDVRNVIRRLKNQDKLKKFG